MSRIYREAYGDIKANKEHDYNEAQRIHDKYAYLYDPKNLENKLPSKEYNLHEKKDSVEDEILTTELSEEELDIIYKKYKMAQYLNSDKIRDIEEEAAELVQDFNAGSAKSGENNEKRVKSQEDLSNNLGLILARRNTRVKYQAKMEEFMA